jgi:NAD-dependent DNA ligase
LEEILLTTEKQIQHPFFEKRIVFTGALTSMTRSQAAKYVREVGGIMQGAVTNDTDFLIVGAKRNGVSTKHKAAMRLEMTGNPIQIIFEEDFQWLIQLETTILSN